MSSEGHSTNEALLVPRLESFVKLPQSGGASLLSCIATLTNTILGAGLLGIPHAFEESGLVVGGVLTCVFAFFSTVGLHLLSEAADRAGRPSDFYAVAEAATPGLGLLIDVAVTIKCFGVATSYLIVVGDNLPEALRGMGVAAGSPLAHRRIWVLLVLIFTVPLTFQKRLDALRFTALFAVGCVVTICISVLLFAIEPSSFFDPCSHNTTGFNESDGSSSNGSMATCHGKVDLATDFEQTVKSLPVFIFAFTCHQNIITITNELQRPTRARAGVVMAVSIGAGLCVYLTGGVAGYATFGSLTASDILENYPDSAGLIIACRVAVSFAVLCAYPLQANPSRRSAISLANALQRRRGRAPWNPNFAHVVASIVFLALSTGIALVVRDIALVMGIVGATGSTTVQYILPGLTYALLFREQREGNMRWKLAVLQCTLGVIIVPLALTLLFV